MTTLSPWESRKQRAALQRAGYDVLDGPLVECRHCPHYDAPNTRCDAGMRLWLLPCPVRRREQQRHTVRAVEK